MENILETDHIRQYFLPSHLYVLKRRLHEQEHVHDANHPETIHDFAFNRVVHLISETCSLTGTRNKTSNIQKFDRNLALSIFTETVQRGTAGLQILGSTRTICHVVRDACIWFNGCKRIIPNL